MFLPYILGVCLQIEILKRSQKILLVRDRHHGHFQFSSLGRFEHVAQFEEASHRPNGALHKLLLFLAYVENGMGLLLKTLVVDLKPSGITTLVAFPIHSNLIAL